MQNTLLDFSLNGISIGAPPSPTFTNSFTRGFTSTGFARISGPNVRFHRYRESQVRGAFPPTRVRSTSRCVQNRIYVPEVKRTNPAVVEEIDGTRVRTTSDGWVETDVLVWATGYRMDLSHLDLSEYRDMDRVDELLPRLGYLMKLLDYPEMYFVGMPLLGSTSATPFFVAAESKTIVSHVRGAPTLQGAATSATIPQV